MSGRNKNFFVMETLSDLGGSKMRKLTLQYDTTLG